MGVSPHREALPPGGGRGRWLEGDAAGEGVPRGFAEGQALRKPALWDQPSGEPCDREQPRAFRRNVPPTCVSYRLRP